MKDGTCEGPGTILGGLPVIAVVDYGKDADTPNGPGDYWAEVQSIHWRKRDGSKGAEVPEHIVERAEKQDYQFCDLSEQVFDHIAHQKWLAPRNGIEARSGEPVRFAPGLDPKDESPVPEGDAPTPSLPSGSNP